MYTNRIKYKLLAIDTRTFETLSNKLKVHKYFGNVQLKGNRMPNSMDLTIKHTY